MRPLPSRALARKRARQQMESVLPTDRRAWAWLLGEPVSEPLRPATPSEAESLPAFGRGVELIASAVANTDWYAARFDRDTNVYERLPVQPTVLERPDPDTDVWQWRYSVAVDLIEYGNHLSILGEPDSRGRPVSLTPQPIDLCAVITEPDGSWHWLIGADEYDRADVLHISAGNRSGNILGRGAVTQYADALGFALAAERYTAKFFAGGGLPPGIIQYQSQPTPAALEQFKQRWRELTLTGEPIALPTGTTLTPVAQDFDKAQLVESRTWNVQLTAIVLGIPSHLFGIPGSSMTYQNVESADIGFVRDTVDRWGQPIARAVSASPILPDTQTLRFDYGSRMRTNLASQADYVTTLKTAGIISIDEARAIIGMAPLQGSTEANATPEGVPAPVPLEVVA